MEKKSLFPLGVFFVVATILAGTIYVRLPLPEHISIWQLGLLAIFIGAGMGFYSSNVFPFSDRDFRTQITFSLLMALLMIFLTAGVIMAFSLPVPAQ